MNTFKAMVLDPQTLRPFLGNRTGGLCGPAIKPIALRMVAEVARAFPDTPVVGMGGVMTGQDALEFIACGATAVAVGAANFTAFEAPRRILAELRAELQAHGFSRLPMRAAWRSAPDSRAARVRRSGLRVRPTRTPAHRRCGPAHLERQPSVRPGAPSAGPFAASAAPAAVSARSPAIKFGARWPCCRIRSSGDEKRGRRGRG